jgi:hypothetical protein
VRPEFYGEKSPCHGIAHQVLNFRVFVERHPHQIVLHSFIGVAPVGRDNVDGAVPDHISNTTIHKRHPASHARSLIDDVIQEFWSQQVAQIGEGAMVASTVAKRSETGQPDC